MSRAPLDVWLYGTRIATVAERNDRLSLAWHPEAVERWGPGARLLSAKLDIGAEPVSSLIKAYLDGLLPEGNARVNHALGAGMAPDDTFGLIHAFGRDTPGAAIFVPTGAPDPTTAGTYSPITSDDVARRLLLADQYWPADSTTITESSTLPGMVPKVTLHRDRHAWFSCQGGAASTWILKRGSDQQSGFRDVIDTEVASLSLARQLGLTTIDVEVLELDTVRAIAVSRYDRTPQLKRIHQEDLAQATGLNTQDPNRKFQWGKGLPSLKQAAAVLQLDGANPDTLLRLVTFSFLLGNTDMHAKNISFLRLADGRVQLSPAYDIAMRLHHHRDNRTFALDINGEFLVTEITIDDVVAEALTWGIPAKRARRVIADLAFRLREALDAIDRSEHPGVSPEAWRVVTQRTQTAVDQLPPATTTVQAPAQPRTPRPPGQRRGPKRPH